MILKIPEITKEIEAFLNETPDLSWSVNVDKSEGLTCLSLKYVPDPGNPYHSGGEDIDISIMSNGKWTILRDEDGLDTAKTEDDLLTAVQKVVSVWPPYKAKKRD